MKTISVRLSQLLITCSLLLLPMAAWTDEKEPKGKPSAPASALPKEKDQPPAPAAVESKAAPAAQATTPAQRKAAMISKGPASVGAMALTFDDGPDPKLTPKLLEYLKKENLPATFFMLGENVQKSPQVAKAVADAGFEIANHSYTHADLSKLSAEKVRDEIKKTQDIIEQVTGKRPKLFRPPYGNVNDTVLRIAEEEGVTVVTWTIDPRDWDEKKSTESVKSVIMKEAAAGAILLEHDIHARTVNLVPELITELREKGMKFTTAGEIVEAEKTARLTRKSSGGTGGGSSSGGVSSTPAQPILVPLNKTEWTKIKTDAEK